MQCQAVFSWKIKKKKIIIENAVVWYNFEWHFRVTGKCTIILV